MAVLSSDEILKIHEAVIAAQLVTSRAALLTGIDRRFVAGLPTAGNPSDQILSDVGAMNDAGMLGDGVVPLATWLATAVARAGEKREAAVFQEALDRCIAARNPEGSGQEELLSPFPGLEFFDEDRAADFFGREAKIEEALVKLAEPRPPLRWLQIDGPSGAGKSSFARAGIVPAVRAGKLVGGPKAWVTAVMRPGHDPIASLAEALVKHARPPLGLARSLDAVTRELSSSPTAFKSLLREGVAEKHGLLLLVDQLEEAFTLARADDGALKQFDALLAAALDDRDGPLLLVTTIRSDFVARMGELPALEGRLPRQAVRYYLRAMGEAGLRAAIEKPAERAELSYEAGLVDRIVGDASTSPGALPLVAHLLQALHACCGGHAMTLRAYEQLGGVGGGLAKSADAIIDGLDEEGRTRARNLLLRLVKIRRGRQDTRQSATREDVLAAAGGGPEAEEALARLSGGRAAGFGGSSAPTGRLVVASGDVGNERVDLVHEALIEQWARLRGWIAEERGAMGLRDIVEESAREWDESGRKDPWLARGDRLASFRSVRDRLDGRALTYLANSEATEAAAERAKRTRIIQLITALAGLAVVFAAVAVLLAWLVRRATKETERANGATKRAVASTKAIRVHQLAAAANLAGYEGKPQLEWLLAVESVRSARAAGISVIDAETALIRSVNRDPPSVPLPESHLAKSVRFSADGKQVLGEAHHEALVWDVSATTNPRRLPGPAEFYPDLRFEGVVLSPDGARMFGFGIDRGQGITVRDDTSVRLLSWVPGAPELALDLRPGIGVPKTLGPRSTAFVTQDYTGVAYLYAELPGVARFLGTDVRGTALSPDGKQLAVARFDGGVEVERVDGLGMAVTVGELARAPSSLAFSRDGQWIVTAGGETSFAVLRADGSTKPRIFRAHSEVRCASFFTDESRVVVGLSDGTVVIRKIRDDEPASDAYEDGAIPSSRARQRRSLLGVGSVVRPADSGGRRHRSDSDSSELTAHEGWVQSVEVSLDGRHLLTMSEGHARLWDLEDIAWRTGWGLSASLLRVAFAGDGLRGVLASRVEPLLWVVQRAAMPAPVNIDSRAIDLDVRPDGNEVAVEHADGTVVVWHLPDGRRTATLRADDVDFHSPRFSPDGRRLLAGASDGSVRVWMGDDLRDAHALKLCPEDNPPHAPVWSQDNESIAVQCQDGAIMHASLREVAPRPLNSGGGVSALLLAPDGEHFQIGTEEGAVSHPTPLWARPISFQNFDNLAQVTALVLSPDGRRLAAAWRDGKLRTSTTATNAWTGVIPDVEIDADQMLFSPDGKHLVTALSKGRLRTWLLDLDNLLAEACSRTGRNLTPEEARRYGISERKTCGQWSAPVGSSSVPVRGVARKIDGSSY